MLCLGRCSVWALMREAQRSVKLFPQAKNPSKEVRKTSLPPCLLKGGRPPMSHRCPDYRDLDTTVNWCLGLDEGSWAVARALVVPACMGFDYACFFKFCRTAIT
jgi:hypothetical protein